MFGSTLRGRWPIVAQGQSKNRVTMWAPTGTGMGGTSIHQSTGGSGSSSTAADNVNAATTPPVAVRPFHAGRGRPAPIPRSKVQRQPAVGAFGRAGLGRSSSTACSRPGGWTPRLARTGPAAAPPPPGPNRPGPPRARAGPAHPAARRPRTHQGRTRRCQNRAGPSPSPSPAPARPGASGVDPHLTIAADANGAPLGMPTGADRRPDRLVRACRAPSNLHGCYFAAVVAVSEPPLGMATVVSLGRLAGSVGRAAAAASRARKAPSSPMVLISGAGNTTVVFLSTPISTRL